MVCLVSLFTHSGIIASFPVPRVFRVLTENGAGLGTRLTPYVVQFLRWYTLCVRFSLGLQMLLCKIRAACYYICVPLSVLSKYLSAREYSRALQD